MTQRELWETESREAAWGTLGGVSEPRADPQVVSHPEVPSWVQPFHYKQLGFHITAEIVEEMVDPTLTGYRLADLACHASLPYPNAPTLLPVPSAPEAELLAREGRDQYRLLLAVSGCGVLLPRADWPRNVNSRYLNLRRAQRTTVTNCESRVCWDSYVSGFPSSNSQRRASRGGSCGGRRRGPRARQQ